MLTREVGKMSCTWTSGKIPGEMKVQNLNTSRSLIQQDLELVSIATHPWVSVLVIPACGGLSASRNLQEECGEASEELLALQLEETLWLLFRAELLCEGLHSFCIQDSLITDSHSHRKDRGTS